MTMHSYSTDGDYRATVLGALGAISYLTTSVISYLADTAASYVSFVAGFGVAWSLVFGILLWLFSKHLWRGWPVRKLGISQVPDLDGDWEGYVKTDYDGHIPDEALHPDNEPNSDWQTLKAEMTITQTWRNINVHLEFHNSHSDSEGATILVQDGKWPTLSYQYDNSPGATSEDSMNPHYGTADLYLKERAGDEVLEGGYYTGPNRSTYGQMCFKRSESAKD